MSIKAILFDFDDTLGDREQYAYAAYAEAISLAASSFSEIEQEAMVQSCMVHDQHGDVNKNYVASRIEQEFGIDITPNNFECLNDWWQHNLGKYAVLFDGVEDVLKELKKRGYKLGIVTNGTSIAQNTKLDKVGIKSYFDTIVISGETPYKKPDVRIFELAANKLGVQTSECCMVGDIFAKDIVGSNRAGMESVWIWTHGDRNITCGIPHIKHVKELLDLYE